MRSEDVFFDHFIHATQFSFTSFLILDQFMKSYENSATPYSMHMQHERMRRETHIKGNSVSTLRLLAVRVYNLIYGTCLLFVQLILCSVNDAPIYE